MAAFGKMHHTLCGFILYNFQELVDLVQFNIFHSKSVAKNQSKSV